MADHPHTIDRWDDATGENLIEQIAAVGDYTVALATYRAAVRRWPKDKITLRNRARIIERSWQDLRWVTLAAKKKARWSCAPPGIARPAYSNKLATQRPILTRKPTPTKPPTAASAGCGV